MEKGEVTLWRKDMTSNASEIMLVAFDVQSATVKDTSAVVKLPREIDEVSDIGRPTGECQYGAASERLGLFLEGDPPRPLTRASEKHF